MITVVSRLSILFEPPFWIGLYEREEGGRYEVCKITFGAEPKEYEVYEFLLENWNRLSFSPSVASEMRCEPRINPKRMQRLAARQIDSAVIGTKAQQALQLQREQCKLERKEKSREQREAEKERRFQLQQEKHKEKHRGH